MVWVISGFGVLKNFLEFGILMLRYIKKKIELFSGRRNYFFFLGKLKFLALK